MRVTTEGAVTLAHLGIERAMAEGATACEAYVWQARHYQASRSSNSRMVYDADHSGVSVRVDLDGRRASAVTSGASERSLLWAATRATATAPLLPKRVGPAGFPEAAGPSTGRTAIHPALADPEPDRLVNIVEEVSAAMLADAGVDHAQAVVATRTGGFHAAKDRGPIAHDVNAYEFLVIELRGSGTRGRRSLQQQFYGRSPTAERLDLSLLAQEAIDTVRIDQRAEQLHRPVTEVILDANAAAKLLGGFLRSFSGTRASTGRGHHAGKLGERIASEALTIHDRPADGIGCRNQRVDDEGLATKDRTLLERGVLKEYVYAWATALHFGATPTGNGLRPLDGRYAGVPVDSVVNAQYEPGSWTLDEMVAEASEAVLVHGAMLGSFLLNSATGEFSAVATAADLVRGGRVVAPLRPVTVAGNLFDVLEDVIGLGRKAVQFPWGSSYPLWARSITCAH